MANYGNNDYWNQQSSQDQTYNFDMADQLNFQSFDGSAGQFGSTPYADTSNVSVPQYGGQLFTPAPLPGGDEFGQGEGAGEYDDEPPLLEELGINPDHIVQKAVYSI